MSQQKNYVIMGLTLSLTTCLLYILNLYTSQTIQPVLSLYGLTPSKNTYFRDQAPASVGKQPACVPVSYNTSQIPGIVRIPMLDGKCKTRKLYVKQLQNKSRCERWRIDESIKLGELVQRRLEYLQNPPNCSTVRKLECKIHGGCGYGCKINTIAACLMLGYATHRTVVVTPSTRIPQIRPLSKTCTHVDDQNATDWGNHSAPYQVVRYRMVENHYMPDILPPAVPADLASKIDGFHGNAFLWWTGQISKYIFQHSLLTMALLHEAEKQSEFSHPIVGVHIRRTDKLDTEAKSHTVEEYMTHVETWYEELDKSVPGVTRKIFLASDDPTVGQKLKSKYPHYTILFNKDIASSSGVEKRKGLEGQAGIIHDIYMLAKCDFLVCTFSSNVCRLAYQLLQTWHGDATNNAITLDVPYFFSGARSDPVPPTIAVNMPTYDDVCMTWTYTDDNI